MRLALRRAQIAAILSLLVTNTAFALTITDPGQGEIPLGGGSGGGLSGIAFKSGNQFFTVADSGAQLFPTTIDVNLASGLIIGSPVIGTPVTLTDGIDLEGLAYDPGTDEVIASDESGPAVRRHPSAGGVGSPITVPAVFSNHLSNLSLESVARQPGSGAIWIANEQALSVDGPTSTSSAGTLIRIANLATGEEWAYMTDPFRLPIFPIGQEQSGASAIVVLADGTVLVLERELSGALPAPFRNRIYEVDFSGASDVSGLAGLIGQSFTPVGKTLLWQDFFVNSNFEGMILGPQLNNGDHTLLLVSDDDGPNDQNLIVLHVQGIVAVPEPATAVLFVIGMLASLAPRRRNRP